MARPFWKGSISFGLVDIPVSLRPAVQDRSLSFTLLDRQDFSPVGYRRYNKNTGEEVPWERIVRGYEYEKDEYVALTDEELKHANVKRSETIEIVGFVKRDEIDPIYFDTPYFVEPTKAKSKSFGLLRAVLERTDRVGVANVVLRTRQHPAALIVRDGVLILNLLRNTDQLQESPEKAESSGVAPSPREVSLAMKLVEAMHTKWKPGEFHDEYHDDVMALIEKKVKSGQTHTIVEPGSEEEAPRRRRDVMDLMPLLQKSLGASARTRAHAGTKSTRGTVRAAKRGTARGTKSATRTADRGRHGPGRTTTERRRRA